MSSLEWQFQNDGFRESLTIRGGVDMHTFPIFESVMQGLSRSGSGVIEIDMREIDSFNSPAVGVLVMLATQRRAHGGNIHVLCMPEGAVAPMVKRARLEGVLYLKFDSDESAK